MADFLHVTPALENLLPSYYDLLAIVIASFKANSSIAVLAIGGAIGYVLLTIFLGRPALNIFARRFARDGAISIQTLTLVLTILMFCAWLTDTIGVYAVFGAFILGTAMPRGEFAIQISDRLEFLTTSMRSCQVYYLQCKDVPGERLYEGCDIFINVNYQDII